MKITKRIPLILLVTISVLLGLDALLYWVDPLGLADLSYSLNAQARIRQPHETGFVFPDGVYQWHYFTVTIQDGIRHTPDTVTDADCTIAFIGDSVTFGYGVNDDETFVNLLAQRFPNVRFLNTARHAYNADNIIALKNTTDADGYVWLMIENDALPPYTYEPASAMVDIPATTIYLLWLLQGARMQPQPDYDNFWHVLEDIQSDDLLIAGFQNDPLAITSAYLYPIALLPPYTQTVSTADKHPNAEGHVQIANNLHPLLSVFIANQCPGA